MDAHHFPHGLFGSDLDVKLARAVRETELRCHVQRQGHIAGCTNTTWNSTQSVLRLVKTSVQIKPSTNCITKFCITDPLIWTACIK